MVPNKMFVYYLTSICLVILVRSEENLIYNISQQNYSTVKCINNILTNNFRCGSLVTFVNPNININQVIEDINRDNICHSIIVKSFNDPDWLTYTNIYIITAENILEFSFGIQSLTRDVIWNPRANFIVQLNNLDHMEEIEELFNILLKYKIYNIILLRSLEYDAVIYTYYPLRDMNCGKQYEEVITLGTCENTTDLSNYFLSDKANELKGCTIKVVASDDVPNFISMSSNYTIYGKFVPGLEQYVLNTIANHMGFVIDYDVFNEDEVIYGNVLPNRSTTGLLNYIDSGKADIAAGGYILMENRVELFDYLYGFNYASYNLYTPAIKSNVWKKLYKEFGISTWCLIGLALVVVIAICFAFKLLLNDATYSILNTWGYFFGNANSGLSKNKNFRRIIFWWSWFTFFMVSFYNTALVSLISVHVHEQTHSISADNLKNLPYKPCISDNSRMFFEFAYNQTLPMGDSVHNCTYTDGALKYVASTKKYYAIEMEYSYSLKEYEYINDEGKHELESWTFANDNIIVIYLVRGLPYREQFQKYANRIYEAGLIKNQLNTLHLRSYTVMKVHPKAFKNTTLLDLRLHFCILIVGYIFSVVCFLLEMWIDYALKKKYSHK